MILSAVRHGWLAVVMHFEPFICVVILYWGIIPKQRDIVCL